MSNLDDFNEGWDDGWNGNPKQKGRSGWYSGAYEKALKGRREDDHYNDKRD